jgi:RNA polymerase sporulation-specific sigma factor
VTVSSALTVGDVGEQVVRRDAFRAVYDRFLESLTAYERRVFERYIRGMTYREISAALSVPTKSVDNAVYRIRVKLKQQLQDQ